MIITIVSASMVITSASYPTLSNLFVTDKEKFTMFINHLRGLYSNRCNGDAVRQKDYHNTIVSTMLYLIFIPLFGGMGASFSMLSGELVVLLVMGIIFRMKLRRTIFFDLYFLKVAFASIISGVIVKGSDMPLVYSIVTGAALYFGISFAIGLITIEKVRDGSLSKA